MKLSVKVQRFYLHSFDYFINWIINWIIFLVDLLED